MKFEFDYLFFCLIASYLFLDTTGLLIPLAISIAFHEMAHIVFLILFKSKITAVKLNVGAILVEHQEIVSKWKNIISLLSGPISNLILSGAFWLLNNEVYCAVNFVVGVYNLLPIKGLDGGSILETICNGYFSAKIIRMIVGFSTMIFCIFIVNFFLKYGTSFNYYSVLLWLLYIITPILLKKILKDS